MPSLTPTRPPVLAGRLRRGLDGASVRAYLLLLGLLTSLLSALLRGSARRDERGDVPGWVLVTVMTAGLVSALYLIAKDELSSMLRTALRSVTT